jgi:hypothetical protein
MPDHDGARKERLEFVQAEHEGRNGPARYASRGDGRFIPWERIRCGKIEIKRDIIAIRNERCAKLQAGVKAEGLTRYALVSRFAADFHKLDRAETVRDQIQRREGVEAAQIVGLPHVDKQARRAVHRA